MSALQIAVTIADRFTDPKNPSSVHNEGRLTNFLTNTAVAFAFVGLFIFYMGAVERNKQHAVIHDYDVAFEFTCPPPEPPMVRAQDTLIPMRFSEGTKPAALSNVDSISKPTRLASKPVETAPTATSREQLVPEAPIAVVAPTRAPADAAPNPRASADAAMAATPAPALAGGGALDGSKGASGAGGTGSGVGTGDKNSLEGADFGATNSISLKAGPVAMGNIRPYTREMIALIQKSWKPPASFDQVILGVDLSHDGRVLDSHIAKGSGNEALDVDLLKAISTIEFPALPEWYHGSHLRMKLVLDNFN